MSRGLILAARHPRPRLTARICYGRTDIPLAEPPAPSAAALIAAAIDPIERIITSPAARARLVAQAVAAATGAPLHTDDRLQEMDFGTWENRPWSSIPRQEIDAWAQDPIHYRPGGAENVQAMLTRLRRAWTTIASAAETTLIITHAGPIRCLLHIAAKTPLNEAIAASIPFGAITRFEP